MKQIKVCNWKVTKGKKCQWFLQEQFFSVVNANANLAGYLSRSVAGLLKVQRRKLPPEPIKQPIKTAEQ